MRLVSHLQTLCLSGVYSEAKRRKYVLNSTNNATDLGLCAQIRLLDTHKDTSLSRVTSTHPTVAALSQPNIKFTDTRRRQRVMMVMRLPANVATGNGRVSRRFVDILQLRLSEKL